MLANDQLERVLTAFAIGEIGDAAPDQAAATALSALMAFVNRRERQLLSASRQCFNHCGEQCTRCLSVGDDDRNRAIDVDHNAGETIAFTMAEPEPGSRSSQSADHTLAGLDGCGDSTLHEAGIERFMGIEGVGPDGERRCAIIEPTCHKAISVDHIDDGSRRQVRRSLQRLPVDPGMSQQQRLSEWSCQSKLGHRGALRDGAGG